MGNDTASCQLRHSTYHNVRFIGPILTPRCFFGCFQHIFNARSLARLSLLTVEVSTRVQAILTFRPDDYEPTKRVLLAAVCVCGDGFRNRRSCQVTLSWDQNPGVSAVSYQISYGTSPGVYTQTVDAGPATSLTVANLNAFQTYYFAVRAYNVLGQMSPYSDEVVKAAQSSMVPDFGTVNGIAPGAADLLWQHDDGWLSVWYMNGASMIDAAYLNPNSVSDLQWRITGAGDFDRDGQVDLVWQHKTKGGVAIWLMDGANLRSSVIVDTASDLNWKMVAVADMNGDWFPDLIWQHGTMGKLAVWFMQGTTSIGSAQMSPGTMPINTWSIVGAGDFDADGSNDLVWQHRDGWLSVWYMNGVSMVDAQYLNPNSVSTRWKVVSVADFNSDGRPDLIFQRDDGYLAAWFLNGLNLISSSLLNPSVVSGGKWKIVGPK